jgi:phosphatidylserine/phosphatidylglycerophosphate/cardiolipin synthase-like enzyme
MTKHSRLALLSILLVSALILAGCGNPTLPAATPVPATSASATTAPGTENLSWLKVYFTNPNPPDNQANGIDRFVVPVLDAATKSIDVASFDFTLPSVTHALVNARKRGVTVRVVLDEVNGDHQLEASESANIEAFDALKALQDAGIPVVNGGRSSGLMHDKIIIVDGTTLFMGSWNMSYNDTFRNNNNLLQITAQKLIANYQAKFNELFVDKRFGTKATVRALTPSMTINGVQVENYFSPPDEVMQKLVAQVKGAQKSIKFMAFTYTHADLSKAMIERAKVGVKVEGVIENRGASQGALVPLFCAKLPVKTDGNKYTMHHKVIIIDDETVITGSFNFTKAADTENDDNVLIIHSKTVAAAYNLEFDRVYGIGQTPNNVNC